MVTNAYLFDFINCPPIRVKLCHKFPSTDEAHLPIISVTRESYLWELQTVVMVVFFWSPFVYGRLSDSVFLVPSLGNGRFRDPSNPSAQKASRLCINFPSEKQIIRNWGRL